MNNNKIFLDKLHYGKEFDNQQGNLEICFAYRDKDGTPKFNNLQDLHGISTHKENGNSNIKIKQMSILSKDEKIEVVKIK